jgi:flavin-dependent dehydrogenase
VQLPGVARLARWGVLDAVLAAGTPVTRDVRFDQGDAVITGRYPAYQGVEAMCSPRRTLLDRVLVDAARAAGAEVRENFAVEEILGDGQVTGIRGRGEGRARCHRAGAARHRRGRQALAGGQGG